MKNLRALAAAFLCLLAVSGATQAAEQPKEQPKQGGIFRIYHRDSPGSPSIHEGATYSVRFRARADAPRSIRLAASDYDPTSHGIGLDEPVSLTPSWQPYHYEFQAKDLAFQNTIQFILGERTGTVWIADFTVTQREP